MLGIRDLWTKDQPPVYCRKCGFALRVEPGIIEPIFRYNAYTGQEYPPEQAMLAVCPNPSATSDSIIHDNWKLL